MSDVSALPLAPKNPLSIRQLLRAVRNLDAGQEVLRDAGGAVTRIQFGPKWLAPPVVAVFSPGGIRDVLGRNDTYAERCVVHEEVQHLAGDSLFVLPQRAVAAAQACAATGLHQAERPQLRRSHVAGSAVVVRKLAGEWGSRPRPRLQASDHAVAGPLGSRPRLDRPRRRDRRAHARGVVLHRRPCPASGARTAVVADAGTGPCARGGGGVAQRHRRHADRRAVRIRRWMRRSCTP